MQKKYALKLREWSLHPKAGMIIDDVVGRLREGRPVFYCLKAGRRFSKTTLVSEIAGITFAELGKRVLYLAPTSEQSQHFWFEVTDIFSDAIAEKALGCDKQLREIWYPKTEVMIKCKTAWNADTARGGWGDLVIHDEYQLMNEDVRERVTLPMMADKNGSSMYIFTPPSMLTAGVSKARDPRHATKLFKVAQADQSGLWKAVHGTSMDNGYLSKEGLELIAREMSPDAYRQEILAMDEDIESSWMVYANDFNESACRINRFPIPKSWPVTSSHDFGQANPAALFAAEVREVFPGMPSYLRYGDVVLFKEYFPRHNIAERHVDDWKKITEGYEVKKRVGGNQNTEEQIRQYYTKLGWRIDAPSKDFKDVKVQVNRVKNLMGGKKIYVFNDLLLLWGDICGMMFEVMPDGKPGNDIKNEAQYHLAACLRYHCTLFDPPVRVVEKERGIIHGW